VLIFLFSSDKEGGLSISTSIPTCLAKSSEFKPISLGLAIGGIPGIDLDRTSGVTLSGGFAGLNEGVNEFSEGADGNTPDPSLLLSFSFSIFFFFVINKFL